MTRRCLMVLAALCGTVALFAQVHEQITVEAVDVPVYVIGQGKPVRNLSKDDFELFVNGKPQAIDYFEKIDFTETSRAPRASEPAPPSQVDLRDRRLFLFLFDCVYNRPAAVARSQRAAIQMVNHALPDDVFAVATIDARHGMLLLTPFLRDRDAVRLAILRFAPSGAHDALAISITGAEREAEQAWLSFTPGAAAGGRSAAMGEDPVPEILAVTRPEMQQRAQALALEHVGGLADLAKRMKDLDGSKHIILFSEGSKLNRSFLSSTLQMTDRLAAAFRSANVFLHTVDLNVMPTGAADPAVMSAPAGPSVVPNGYNEMLLLLSAKTGGRWIHWTNLIAPALDDLSLSYSAGYRIGFKPAKAHKGANDIDVKVRNLPAGATVSFRKGFSVSTPSAAPSKGAPDALLLADIIQNDTPQHGTPPEIAISGRRINVIVPAIQLSKQFGAIDGADVMLYVFDGSGFPVISKEKTFVIAEHATADRVIQQKVELPPGKYVAKVLLRVGGSLGFAKEPFEIEPDE